MKRAQDPSPDTSERTPLDLKLLPERTIKALVVGRCVRLLEGLRQDEPARLQSYWQARKLAKELLQLPHTQACQRINLSRGRLYSSYLVLELVQRAGKAAPADATEALRIVSLAELVQKRIPQRLRTAATHRWRRDISARLWCERANAFRIQRELPAARRAFRYARQLLRTGSGDAELRARYATLLGSYCWTTDRRWRASLAFGQAATLYEDLGEEKQLGEVQLCQAGLLNVEGRLQDATALQAEALSRLDEDAEPVTALAAYTNLAEMMQRRGEPGSALSVLAVAEHLAESLPGSRALGVWYWIRGRCRITSGDPSGEGDLLNAWRILEPADDTYSLGLIGTDLCRHYLDRCNLGQLEHWIRPTVRALEQHAPSPFLVRELAKLGESVERLTFDAARIGQALQLVVETMVPRGQR